MLLAGIHEAVAKHTFRLNIHQAANLKWLLKDGPVLSHSSLLLLPPKAVGASRAVWGCLPHPHPFSLLVLLLRQKQPSQSALGWRSLSCPTLLKMPVLTLFVGMTTLLVVSVVLCTTSQRPATNWAVHLGGNRDPGGRDRTSFLGLSSRSKLWIKRLSHSFSEII